MLLRPRAVADGRDKGSIANGDDQRPETAEEKASCVI